MKKCIYVYSCNICSRTSEEVKNEGERLMGIEYSDLGPQFIELDSLERADIHLCTDCMRRIVNRFGG